MKTACARARAALALGVHDGLDETGRAAALEHARRCPECADAVGFEIELMGEIERSPLEPLPDHYFQGVLEEIHKRMPARVPAAPGRKRRWEPSREVVATAACVGMALMWWAVARTPGPKATDGIAGPKSALTLAGGDGNGDEGMRTGPAARVAPAEFVLAKGIGLTTADAPILQLPAELLAEVGIREIKRGPIL